jgi:hypothetical protein
MDKDTLFWCITAAYLFWVVFLTFIIHRKEKDIRFWQGKYADAREEMENLEEEVEDLEAQLRDAYEGEEWKGEWVDDNS